MSVNRNILKSYSNPVLEPNQVPIELVTNAGSRWVILNWPVKTYISSSQGGDCEGLTVQWSTDSRFASEPDDYYTNITQSVLSCDSSSLVPLTGSLGWSIFINSSYNFQADNQTTSSVYYIRSFQNTSGGGRGPYSNVLSLDTRAPNIYNNGVLSMGLLKPVVTGSAFNYRAGATGSLVIFTTDSYNPTSSNLQAWSGDSSNGNNSPWTGGKTNMPVTASITGSGTYIIKTLGPNYDGIATNGATWSFQLYGSPSASGFEFNGINNGEDAPDVTSSIALVGIVSGSMQIVGNGGFEMTVYATPSSSKLGSGSGYKITNSVTTQYGKFAMNGGYDTINKPVGCYSTEFMIAGDNDIGFLYPGIAQTASAYSRALGSQVTINTSPDCVFTSLYLGVRPDIDQYRLQYGQYEQPWSVGVSSSAILPIPSSSVLQLWSGFGYRYSPYSDNGYPVNSFGWMDNNPTLSKWNYVNGANYDYPGLITGSGGYYFPPAGQAEPFVTVLTSSIAGISGSSYTLQFVGTLYQGDPNSRYVILQSDKNNTATAAIRNDISGSTSFLDLLKNNVANFRYPITVSDDNQILTIQRSGSVMNVYQNQTKLTPILSSSVAWSPFGFEYDAVGTGFNIGNSSPNETWAQYRGTLNSLLLYSRSLNDSELTASYDYFL